MRGVGVLPCSPSPFAFGVCLNGLHSYNSMAPTLFSEAEAVPNWVSSVKWDAVKECSASSDYVKRVVGALKALSKKLAQLVGD